MHRASGPLAQLVEQLTFNQWVTGSNPVRLTTIFNDLAPSKRLTDYIRATLGLFFILDSVVYGVGGQKFDRFSC